MLQSKFDEKKNLIGQVVSANDKYYKVITNYDNYNNIISTSTEEINEFFYNNHYAMFNV